MPIFIKKLPNQKWKIWITDYELINVMINMLYPQGTTLKKAISLYKRLTGDKKKKKN